MAVGAAGLDATAYPANTQTMTASVVAQNLSDVRMVNPSSSSLKPVLRMVL
jgi:hypothetical protein